jgi:endogenous inhibitor of DNA gyrase (YacG/DUF329 family)
MTSPLQRGDTAPVRWLKCPTCAGPARYAADNPARPFCSPRCRSHDLGAWASEGFRVPAAEPSDPAETPGD